MSKPDVKPPLAVVKTNRVQVTSATLHQAVLLPGLIHNEKNLNQTKTPGAVLELGPEGLWVSGMTKDGRPVRGLIPAANVAICMLDTQTL